MNYKVLIYSKYPIVAIGLSLFVVKNIPKVLIYKTNNLDFLLTNNEYDLFILDVFIQSELNFVQDYLRTSNKSEKVILLTENIDFNNLKAFKNIKYLHRNSNEFEIVNSIRIQLKKRKMDNKYKSVIKTIENKEKLSKREVECAILLMKGYTVNQISKKLSLALTTISTYKMRILKKTNTNNIVELTKSLYNLENI
jgi:DNA-binding NarL/FixJ family response regulator